MKEQHVKTQKVIEKEICALNNSLFNEFQIEELEKRFETDPLILTHLFNWGTTDDNSYVTGCACRKIESCPELKCGSDS